MKSRTLEVALLLATFAAPAAFASFGGGPSKDEPSRPAPQGISSISLTPRQEAERLYADALEEVEKAKKDLEAGKSKNAEKKFRKALDRGEHAVEIDPKYHEAWNLVGYASRHLKNYDRALAAYDKCLALKPDYAPAREYLGEAYLELGQPEKAREQLAWLQRAVPSSEEAKDLAKEVAEYDRAHAPAAADSARSAGGARPDSSRAVPADSSKVAPADSSKVAPADTSGAGRGGK